MSLEDICSEFEKNMEKICNDSKKNIDNTFKIGEHNNKWVWISFFIGGMWAWFFCLVLGLHGYISKEIGIPMAFLGIPISLLIYQIKRKKYNFQRKNKETK